MLCNHTFVFDLEHKKHHAKIPSEDMPVFKYALHPVHKACNSVDQLLVDTSYNQSN